MPLSPGLWAVLEVMVLGNGCKLNRLRLTRGFVVVAGHFRCQISMLFPQCSLYADSPMRGLYRSLHSDPLTSNEYISSPHSCLQAGVSKRKLNEITLKPLRHQSHCLCLMWEGSCCLHWQNEDSLSIAVEIDTCRLPT
jgi:hypothetical protein